MELTELAPDQVESPEQPAPKAKKGYLSKAFAFAGKTVLKTMFHPYLVLPMAVYAGGLRAYVATEQFVESKYGARNDWTTPGSCSVQNAADGKVYNFASKGSRDIAKGTNIVSNARDAFIGCRDVMKSSGFKFGQLDVSYDLQVEQMRGFNGSINGSMGGVGHTYNPDRAAEAVEYMKELPYYALKRDMQLTGKANTPDWYLYHGLTLQREFTQWADGQWQGATERLNGVRTSIADWIRPPSPSLQGSGSQTSSGPQAQSPQ